MKVKLIADGTIRGTKLLDGSGNAIEGVTKVAFIQEGGSPPTLVAEIVLVEVDVDGEANIFGPNGKKVAKIVYEDGSEQEYPTTSETGSLLQQQS